MKEELYMQNAMIIDPKDNVAVAIEPIAAGDTQYQSNKDLYRQGQFFLFFHRIRSLFHTF